MAQSHALAMALAFAAMFAIATAQPFMFEAGKFQTGVQEAAARREDNYSGFVFNFNDAKPSAADDTPNGNLILNQVATNPFLSTLPGDGNGQTLITLGPCSGNTPHSHPRGSEISFMLYGSIEFGMVEENSGQNRLVIANITQNETIHIPTGIMHFSFNYQCEPAAFLANFATKDPGTQTTWNSLMRIPTHILNSATTIPERLINGLKQFPQVTAPGTGGEECLRRCNINQQTANKLTPLNATELLP
ncbi:hypothetical protein WJX73_003686 [Symbiochloris irregularis]|uniref:Germin-like protein n=1 Tax=Symbiochloris irregularis TaxID=706552 RepID=A0AAW1NTP8_9CHLO